MATVTTSTKPLSREKLARFLVNHEAIVAFESLVSDVTGVLPDAIDVVDVSAASAQTAADNAQATADNALEQSNILLAIVAALEQAETQISTLREDIAAMSRRIDALEQG